MRRRQLIEIEDQPWCPAAVRDGLTDYLQFITDRTEPYAPAARLLAEALRASTDGGAGQPPIPVVDLGSGGGGPWRRLVRRLHDAGVPVRVRLTDLHPNVAAFDRIGRETDGMVSGEPRAVPADAVPQDLVGFRTIFTAFHHFPPAMARGVLADAVARGQGIAVFESTTRDLRCLLFMLLVPTVVLLTTPFIRPFRWSSLLLTYLFPVLPSVAFLDGVVSCLRTYTPDELRGLAESVDGAGGYEWAAGYAGGGPIPMTYLVGVPVRRDATSP
jgi:hypothetical protein